MLSSVCPTMPASDFDATIPFYGRLGFRLGGRYEAEGYLILRRDKVELHFFRREEIDPYKADHSAYIHTEDALGLSDEFAALGLPGEGFPRFVPAEAKPWGMMELAILDGDGNLLRIGSDMEAL
ncbi:MAG: VOC family protein [Pseudomonadota bacterium]